MAPYLRPGMRWWSATSNLVSDNNQLDNYVLETVAKAEEPQKSTASVPKSQILAVVDHSGNGGQLDETGIGTIIIFDGGNWERRLPKQPMSLAARSFGSDEGRRSGRERRI